MPKSDINTPKILSQNLFPVVGIGASAGGLDAFKKLISTIPEDSGMAYILVQHLHPQHESALPEILQRISKIPVIEISDNVKVSPNNIYVIPANKMLIATDGILKLSPREAKNKINLPIDVFFSSLAEIHQAHAIGVILSGTGADGTAGLKDIKDNGGLTLAQDPATSSYDGMPQSAIDAGIVDFVMAPEKISEKLMELRQVFAIDAVGGSDTAKDKINEDGFRQILALLRVRVGVDFNFYKQTTVRRRIIRRMLMLKLESVKEYVDYLKKNKTELDVLFQDLLIPVTSFFRDKPTFDMLCETVFPEILKNRQANNPLRFWIAGCSTGQEAYSIAMCLHEYMSDHISTIKVQIFATDLSEIAIKKARYSVYSKKELEGVSQRRLDLFFNKIDGHYQVKKTVRDMCIFAVHNFVKDPPFAKMDFISCRNVLIYLEPFLQKKALNLFHYALNDKGILLLGKSETTGSASDVFIPYGKKDKYFVKKALTGKFINLSTERRETTYTDKNYFMRTKEGKTEDFQKNADDVLLQRYTPVGVVVNEQYDIVEFRGATGEYLEPSSGRASLNVMKMAKEGLSFEIRNALHQAKTTKASFVREGIPINAGKKIVTVEVVPLLNTLDLHFLVLFRDTINFVSNEEIIKKGHQHPLTESKGVVNRILQLEKELAQAREDMRSITEEQEASNEELQSSNEELLSGSEELQSLNEELETSKEELQSTNEELITVNQELYDRNEELNQSRKFAEATLAVLHEPLLVLDKNFMVKSANAAFYKIFHITEEETLGKHLFSLQSNSWDILELRKELSNVQQDKGHKVEVEIIFTFPTMGERNICVNIQPIIRESGEQLILLALDDITLAKNASERFRMLAEAMPQKMNTTDAEGNIDYLNQQWFDYTHMKFEQLKDWGWDKIMHPEDLAISTEKWRYSLDTGEEFKLEQRFLRHDGVYHWHLTSIVPYRDHNGKIVAWIATHTDIDEQKIKEQQKDEFIGIASHEMKTPLTTAKAYLQLLEMSVEGDKTLELYAKKANDAVERLHTLITELLDASKIQNGQLNYNITTFNFSDMVSNTIEDIKHSYPKHQIIKKGKISRIFQGDENRLQQVIINLLTNAIKYAPKVYDILVKVEEGENQLTVSVTDKGIGMSKAHLEKVFDRYYRVQEHAIQFQGLGIGLYISYDIVLRHGGKMWVESELGKGSTFYFTLPFVND